MRDVAERLKAQNNGTSWVDCNERSRPRPHAWRFEFLGEAGAWYRCKRCKVSTVVPHGTVDSRGVPVYPAPYLR